MDQGSLGDAGGDLKGPVGVGASSEALAAAGTGAEELDAANPGVQELKAADPVAEELKAADPSVEELEGADPGTGELIVADPAGPVVERGGAGRNWMTGKPLGEAGALSWWEEPTDVGWL